MLLKAGGVRTHKSEKAPAGTTPWTDGAPRVRTHKQIQVHKENSAFS